MRCTVLGCRQSVAIRCGYTDRRQRVCATTWCIEHGAVLDDDPYCRRHASTVAALSNGFYQLGMPNLEARAPSLVAWMSEELDAPIRAAMRASVLPGDWRLITDPVRHVFTPGGGAERCWLRVWKLVDHLSVLRRVSVEVDERDDCEVRLRVGTELIGQGVPPWIERRRRGETVDAGEDARSRKAFAGAMARAIELVLTREEIASGF